MSDDKIVTTLFLDMLGRTIIGEKVAEDDKYLSIKNPAVISIMPQQQVDPATGQQVQRMAIQIFPVVFREILADKENGVVFKYDKNGITLSDSGAELDFKLGMQYRQMFMAPTGAIQPQNAAKPPSTPNNVIKLFED